MGVHASKDINRHGGLDVAEISTPGRLWYGLPWAGHGRWGSQSIGTSSRALAGSGTAAPRSRRCPRPRCRAPRTGTLSCSRSVGTLSCAPAFVMHLCHGLQELRPMTHMMSHFINACTSDSPDLKRGPITTALLPHTFTISAHQVK